VRTYLGELARRKDLILHLVASNLKAQHRNTYLGYLWWLLDPLLGVLIYYFVVVVIFHRGGEGYGPRLVIGMIVWRWLSATIGAASHSIVGQAGIITQVYLPKAAFPATTTLSGVVNFGFGLLVVAVLFLFWGIMPGLALIWLPYVVVVQALFTLALALAVAYACVFLRDTDTIVNHVMRLWFFATPVIWPENLIPERVLWLVAINPMSHLLSAYRGMAIEDLPPDPLPLFVIGLASTAGALLMLAVYARHEHRIIKAL
jgi:ABC-type polysaccharide/polyol phosphate export permease